MFLVRIADNLFIDAEKIHCIYFEHGEVKIEVIGQNEDDWFKVDGKYTDLFLNNIQALNRNISDIGHAYREVMEENNEQ